MKKFVLSILMGLLSFMTISFVSPPTGTPDRPKGGVSDDRCQIDSSVVVLDFARTDNVLDFARTDNVLDFARTDKVLDFARTDKVYRTGCVYDTCSNADSMANAVFYQSSTADTCNLHIDPGLRQAQSDRLNS